MASPLPEPRLVLTVPGARGELIESRRRNGTRVVLQTYSRIAAGAARPVYLFVHGMAGCADNFIFQMRALAALDDSFVAYDLVGCGASGALAGANLSALEYAHIERYFAPPQLVDDLEAAWRHVTRGGARACVVVAHSYSTSLVTQWLASAARAGRAAPARGVVLVETHASLPPIGASRAARFARALPLALRYAATSLYEGPVRWWSLWSGGESAALGPLGPAGARSPEAKRLWLRWEHEKSAALYAASVCTCDWACEADFAAAYARTPLAVCWGDADALTPVDPRFWSRAVAPALRALKVCAGYGHWPFLDNDDFTAWLLAVGEAFRGGGGAPLVIEPPPLAPLGDEPGAACSECGAPAARDAAFCGAECWQLARERGRASAR